MQDKSRLLQQRTASFVCLLFVSQMFIFIKGNVCTLHGPVGWMLFPQFARRTGPPWRMSGVLIKCWQLTFLQTTDIMTFVQNMIYSLHITWLLPDCRIERWRGGGYGATGDKSAKWTAVRVCVSALRVKLLDVLDEGPWFHWACSRRVAAATIQPVRRFRPGMSKLFHKGPVWLQVFFSTKQPPTRPESFNQLISVLRKLIGLGWLEQKPAATLNPRGIVWTCLVYTKLHRTRQTDRTAEWHSASG